MTPIDPEDIYVLLLRIIAGEVPIHLDEPEPWTWDTTYCGNVGFVADGWALVFFNDCDELDYLDSATAPDGREACFNDLVNFDDAGKDPVGMLNDSERLRLGQLLRQAERAPR